eukprot:scaffold1001_cov169-Amphora_coffeaeformis.AAC.18
MNKGDITNNTIMRSTANLCVANIKSSCANLMTFIASFLSLRLYAAPHHTAYSTYSSRQTSCVEHDAKYFDRKK